MINTKLFKLVMLRFLPQNVLCIKQTETVKKTLPLWWVWRKNFSCTSVISAFNFTKHRTPDPINTQRARYIVEHTERQCAYWLNAAGW